MRFRRWATALALAGVALAVAATEGAGRAEPLLNEVLYDPAGADTGSEFVELYNPDTQPYPLADCTLEFANGAAALSWLVRWTGAAADTIDAGGHFLIVDQGWTGLPAGDATARLQLQNGPDAIRLRLPDGRVDRLGYGALTDPGFFETEPHPGSGVGGSLARRPDGHDTDHNAADWVVLAEPTPGALNFAAHALKVGAFKAEPPSLPGLGSNVSVTLHVTNTGLLGLPGQAVGLRDARSGEQIATWLEPLGSGEGRTLRFDWRPQTVGRTCFTLTVVAAPDDSLSAHAGCYQVGAPDVYLSEVMAAPPAGGSEWVELGNAGDVAVDLRGYRLSDEDGDALALPADILAPGGFLVLVQDRAKFAAWWESVSAAGAPPACANGPVAAARTLTGGWPALNNSAPAGRDYADRVTLVDPQATVVDHVRIGANGATVPAGRSLERARVRPLGDPDRNWGPCLAPAGATPACPNSLAAPVPAGGDLELLPNPYCRDAGSAGGVHLLFSVAADEQGWDAKIFNLWGRDIRDLGGDRLGPGPRDVIWDGRDDDDAELPPGAYITLVRRFDAAGQIRRATKRLAVIAPRGPG